MCFPVVNKILPSPNRNPLFYIPIGLTSNRLTSNSMYRGTFQWNHGASAFYHLLKEDKAYAKHAWRTNNQGLTECAYLIRVFEDVKIRVSHNLCYLKGQLLKDYVHQVERLNILKQNASPDENDFLYTLYKNATSVNAGNFNLFPLDTTVILCEKFIEFDPQTDPLGMTNFYYFFTSVSLPLGGTKGYLPVYKFNFSLALCTDGTFVMNFMGCSTECIQSTPKRHFEKADFIDFEDRRCTNFDSFQCEDNLFSIPYSLVCDESQNCLDNSDQKFCKFESCPEAQCKNKQCIGKCIYFNYIY